MRRWVALALFLAIGIASQAPIRSPDAYWHLAAGRWIAEHRGLPQFDPLAVASARIPWINGEWLYELWLYCAWAIGGLAAIPWANAVMVALIFTVAFLIASREQDVSIAALFTAIAFACIADRMTVRPSTAAALFVVLAIAILNSPRAPLLRYTLLTVLWINVHPSALLAPIIAATTVYVDRRRWMVPAASAVALFVNPYGLRGIIAPFELMAMQRQATFINTEWLPSPPLQFPMLYLTIVAVAIAFAMTPDKRRYAWRAAVFAVLAFLAVTHVRHQTLFFPALPVLLPPIVVPSLKRWGLVFALTTALIALGGFSIPRDSYFPDRAVARLRESGLGGNIYTVDQFGGFLIWNFYGQRRVTTDGRNELYRQYIAEDLAAHRDSRAWAALIRKYSVAIAVDDYRPPIIVADPGGGGQRRMPASLVWYPRNEWALIAFDDAAMIFARRAAFPPDALRPFEYPNDVVPDAAGTSRR